MRFDANCFSVQIQSERWLRINRAEPDEAQESHSTIIFTPNRCVWKIVENCWKMLSEYSSRYWPRAQYAFAGRLLSENCT